jgi:hypothetical protein
MKLQTTSTTNSVSSENHPQWRQGSPSRILTAIAGGSLAIVAMVAEAPAPVTAAPIPDDRLLAQALPTPLPPLPTGSEAPLGSGEQYLVLVNGNSDLLLQQVRQVEPGAFVNYVGGQSVIQAGRFSSYQNAQVRANELANFGIGAEVQATDFAGAPIAVTPPSDYSLSYPVPSQATAPIGQSLPTSTIAATPSPIEFGQAAPFQATASPSAAAFPPPAPVTAPTNASPPPLTAPVVSDDPLASGYYVVVPGSRSELSTIASQVITLGAPSSLVKTRTSPRGPHVAVGPYEDHGIAQEWTNYLRDSGVSGARVHFE